MKIHGRSSQKFPKLEVKKTHQKSEVKETPPPDVVEGARSDLAKVTGDKTATTIDADRPAGGVNAALLVKDGSLRLDTGEGVETIPLPATLTPERIKALTGFLEAASDDELRAIATSASEARTTFPEKLSSDMTRFVVGQLDPDSLPGTLARSGAALALRTGGAAELLASTIATPLFALVDTLRAVGSIKNAIRDKRDGVTVDKLSLAVDVGKAAFGIAASINPWMLLPRVVLDLVRMVQNKSVYSPELNAAVPSERSRENAKLEAIGAKVLLKAGDPEAELDVLSTIGDEVALKQRSGGDWYLTGLPEVKRGAFLVSPTQSGETKDDAIHEAFAQFTEGTVVLDAMKDSRLELAWSPSQSQFQAAA